VSVRARLVLVVLIACASLAAAVLIREERPAATASASPGRSPLATERPGLPIAEPRMYEDQAFDPRLLSSPTASKAQSKLWYAQGAWWSLLVEPSSHEVRIHRLDPDGSRWKDTGTLVDERPQARGDALAVGDRLYVATAGVRARAEDAIRLIRYTFLDGAYRLDPDFPLTLSTTGVESVVLARDSTERLWITYTSAERVFVRASGSDDHDWLEPFTPLVRGMTVAPDDISALVAFGDSVGLMWSNQREDTVYFTAHRDTEQVDVWSPAEVVSRGLKQPDDHINMKADANGRIYAALKTSLDTRPNPNPLAPQILLVVRNSDGVWQQHVVARLKDRHTRPIVLIDEERDEVYVVATAPATGGSIYYKRSSLADVSFETGVGTLLVSSAGNARINNATSAKDSLSFSSGLVVLASDNTTGRYLHAVLEIGGVGSGPPPPESPQPGDLDLVVNDSFDGWRVGPLLEDHWSVRNAGSGGATVQARPGRGNVGRVAATDDGQPPRACRSFVPIRAGAARLSVDVRVRGSGRSEGVAALVRGSSGDATQLRFDDRGTFSYTAGQKRVISGLAWRDGAWYRIDLDLDLDAHTVGITIDDGPGGSPPLRVRDVPWPSKAASIDEICFQAPAGRAGLAVEFDDLRVARARPAG
jgi:hypothetical protein